MGREIAPAKDSDDQRLLECYEGISPSRAATAREDIERIEAAYSVMWWIEAGQVPTLEEADERLETLRRNGPSARAFTFKQPFPPE